MEKIFQTVEYKILAAVSILLGLNTLFFLAHIIKPLGFLVFSKSNAVFYFLYIILGVCLYGTLLFFSRKIQWEALIAKKLLVLFPTAVLFIIAFTTSKSLHYIFKIFVGLYIVSAILYLISLHRKRSLEKIPNDTTPKTSWLALQKKSTLVILTLLMIINFGFGSYHIAKFAAVDEALWTFGGRIEKYWTNIAKHDWENTKVSDKPGVTVSLISGTGLLLESPKDFRSVKWEAGGTSHPKNDITKLNFALRFPIFLFTVLMLPVFYFFLERLFGERKALISTIFIGTSPILLGMARIINPDSILWIFAPLSLISYFIFLKQKRLHYLYWAGIFLGLALLTKYVANILFIFFFGLIFLEYILLEQKERLTIDFVDYIKKSFLHYLILTAIALIVFYILYPAVWVKPSRLLQATLLSQAFKSTWPLFISIISFVFIDQWLMKNKITQSVLDAIANKKHWLTAFVASLFLFSVTFVIINSLTGMHWLDFEEILASPKSAYAGAGFTGIFLGNFYPLIFGIHPIALICLVVFSVFLIRHTKLTSYTYQAGLYFIFFILIYYLGTTVNHVATISRYQIMLFPIAFILTGIVLTSAIELFLKKFPNISFTVVACALLGITTLSLALSVPLYSGYVSVFLPNEYYTNIKDMGDGNYEVAEFLNHLPNAKTITVWSDKSGVCTFFIGNCYSGLNYNSLKEKNFDYIIVSSGRESRTTKMVQGAVLHLKPNVMLFDKYYTQTENLSYALYINNRPGNFVKVMPYVKD